LCIRSRHEERPRFLEDDASLIVSEPPSDQFEKAARLAQSPLDVHGDMRADGVMQSVVAPGQIVTVEFAHHEPRPGWLAQQLANNQGILVLELTYTDIAGGQETATRLIISGNGDDPTEPIAVRRVEPLVRPQLYEAPSNMQRLARQLAEGSR
jgi:hypothetical protein